MTAIDTLIDAGLTLRSDGGRLIVTPASAVTEEIRRLVRAEKAAILEAVRDAERQFTVLVDAINRCCDVRGDSDSNRAALINECRLLKPVEQADLSEHFDREASRYTPRGKYG